jgi:hypothetical protein
MNRARHEHFALLGRLRRDFARQGTETETETQAQGGERYQHEAST